VSGTAKLAFEDYSRLIRRMAKDERLISSHVSLCSALFVAWQKAGYTNPFGINRKQLMVFSKIASIATYHKCIKELHDLGYIRYQPSFSPKAESLVYWPGPDEEHV
jgi:hypothetical protein